MIKCLLIMTNHCCTTKLCKFNSKKISNMAFSLFCYIWNRNFVNLLDVRFWKLRCHSFFPSCQQNVKYSKLFKICHHHETKILKLISSIFLFKNLKQIMGKHYNHELGTPQSLQSIFATNIHWY